MYKRCLCITQYLARPNKQPEDIYVAKKMLRELANLAHHDLSEPCPSPRRPENLRAL
jgi:hypothetical protein